MDSPKLPVVDLSGEDLRPGTQIWISTSKQVCHALEEYGCFLIKSNQVSLDLHNAIYTAALRDLFNLPKEIKQLIKSSSEQPYRDVFSSNPNHEGIAMGDIISTSEAIHQFSNLAWPAGNSHFCESVNEISKIMMNLDQTVLRMVFQNYGVDKYYDSQIRSTDYVTGSSMYKESEKNENYVGLVIHTDKTFSTIIHQNDVNGLEIQTKDGQWILYEPSSHSSFLYLAADAFKAWSNGRIHPCCHRVTMSVNKTRFSLGLFTFLKGVTHVPDELIDEEHPLRYKPFSHREYHRLFKEHGKKKIQYSIEALCGV
ncbi:hypothetical protein Pint_30005 [Pistacia integerrima]|uniref:Uncharacterized protein n=1 Tax=Pistacia integerrima TaxID=434235 RepID=A0ACC0WX21_9ROSI|nr:hypothetical protein Pint_30005 [Pistacia integerrima]